MSRFSEEGIRYYSKYIATVEISDPVEVTSELSATGNTYDPGMVMCSCPELGLGTGNFIPCRYALSVPYYKVQDGDRVWIEPTIGETDRWIYTGFVDCGNDDNAPTVGGNTTDQGIMISEDGVFTFVMGDLSIVLDSAGKTITVDTDGTGAAKITLDGTTPTIVLEDGSGNKVEMTNLGIKLTTTDASGWLPNTLAVDPFSGVPHGGTTAGIAKLKGG